MDVVLFYYCLKTQNIYISTLTIFQNFAKILKYCQVADTYVVFLDGNKISLYYYNTTGWLLLKKNGCFTLLSIIAGWKAVFSINKREFRVTPLLHRPENILLFYCHYIIVNIATVYPHEA
jgi:hypothetical protein